MNYHGTDTTVRIVTHGPEHPYGVEVTTPGWKGVDHGFDGTIKQTMPADLKEISDVLEKAGVKYYSPSEPDKEGVMLFLADGTTEFAFRNAADFGEAIKALVRAGWLSPEITHHLKQ